MSFFTNRSEGWYWYKETYEKESNDKKIKNTKTAKKILAEKLNTAILNPTIENIRNYQIEQKKWVERSQLFAINWMKSVIANPEIDNTANNPTSYYGIHAKREVETIQKEKRIKKISQSYGLFFFYQDNCQFCRTFARVIKLFSQKYDYKVIAISIDSSKIDEFPEAKHNNGIVEAWQVKQTPALFMVNPETQHVVPISYGLVSVDDIEERIMMLLG